MTEEHLPAPESPLNASSELQINVEESLSRAKEQVTHFGERLSTRVRERPVTAIVIAAGIGYLSARLFLPRHRS